MNIQISPHLRSITADQTGFTFAQLTEVVNATQWKVAVLDKWL